MQATDHTLCNVATVCRLPVRRFPTALRKNPKPVCSFEVSVSLTFYPLPDSLAIESAAQEPPCNSGGKRFVAIFIVFFEQI